MGRLSGQEIAGEYSGTHSASDERNPILLPARTRVGEDDNLPYRHADEGRD